DGELTDQQETIDALVTASDLPLSILIVGVGGADFKELEVLNYFHAFLLLCRLSACHEYHTKPSGKKSMICILDADKGEKLRSSTGRVASRDIVQFVPFRDIQGGGMSVVQSLLAELPSQFLTYMRNNGIQP
ncbi:hypothetical protein M8C21_025682, partial [Ambrosia artemisiifolia]